MVENKRFLSGLRDVFSRRRIDEDVWDDLEETLIRADFGSTVTENILEHLQERVQQYRTDDVRDLKRMLNEELNDRLSAYNSTLKLKARPSVILVVGVNGVGKTTTIGKFANFLKNAGRSVVVGAADTFRAAAVEQLSTWADRAGVAIVKPQAQGQDPASVAYQTVEYALKNNIEMVIIDTAGRLQTKTGLMDELGKIRRVIEKQSDIAEILLVLDATTGQNGVVQAQAFIDYADITGLVITKMDGSARAGFIFQVQERTGLPVKLIGQGEGIQDLTGFTPHIFVQQLLEE